MKQKNKLIMLLSVLGLMGYTSSANAVIYDPCPATQVTEFANTFPYYTSMITMPWHVSCNAVNYDYPSSQFDVPPNCKAVVTQSTDSNSNYSVTTMYKNVDEKSVCQY